jgi:hypothetical protein
MILYVHINLVFPFAQIVCVFADDLGGNKACARYLENWFRLELQSVETDARSCPQLVVVTADLDDVNALVQTECHPRFNLLFDSLVILTSEVSARRSDPAAQFLQARLKSILDDVRRDRQSHHLLLSARHVAGAFSCAIQNFTRNPRKTVDIFLCSFGTVPSPSNVSHHLSDFFTAAAELNPRPESVSDFIASALLVQAYPPQRHCECSEPFSRPNLVQC